MPCSSSQPTHTVMHKSSPAHTLQHQCHHLSSLLPCQRLHSVSVGEHLYLVQVDLEISSALNTLAFFWSSSNCTSYMFFSWPCLNTDFTVLDFWMYFSFCSGSYWLPFIFKQYENQSANPINFISGTPWKAVLIMGALSWWNRLLKPAWVV